MRVVGVLLGLMVGLVLWGALLICYIYVVGPVARAPDLLVIFSPIIGLVLPVALNLLAANRAVLCTWLLALAPPVGLLNIGVYSFIAKINGYKDDAWPLILVTLVWTVPALMLFRKLRTDSAEKKDHR